MNERTGARGGATEMEDEIASAAAGVADKVKEKGSELGRKAGAAMESGREAVADKIEGMAHGLHRGADSIEKGQSKVTSVAHRTADKLESAARYVRDREPKEMLSDLGDVIRAHPGKSLLAVLALGFLAGRALQRD